MRAVTSFHSYLRPRALRPTLMAVGLGVLAIGGAIPAIAQTGGGYDLHWNVIAGGGATFSVGGAYSLGGSIGQATVGVASGGAYALQGGFWAGGAVATGVSDGPGIGTQPATPGAPLPAVQRLLPSAPNPFNPRTVIAFDLPRPESVRLEVFDVRGALVRVLLREERPAGHHSVVWQGDDRNGRPVASGSYILRLSTTAGTQRQKLTLVR